MRIEEITGTFPRVEEKKDQQSPAIVDITTGELWLGPLFFTFPEAVQRYILFHEQGHYVLQTTDQEAANHYAEEQFMDPSTPERFQESLEELSQVHDFLKTVSWDPEEDLISESQAQFLPILMAGFAAVGAIQGVAQTIKGNKAAKRQAEQAANEQSAYLLLQNVDAQKKRAIYYIIGGVVLLGVAVFIYFKFYRK